MPFLESAATCTASTAPPRRVGHGSRLAGEPVQRSEQGRHSVGSAGMHHGLAPKDAPTKAWAATARPTPAAGPGRRPARARQWPRPCATRQGHRQWCDEVSRPGAPEDACGDAPEHPAHGAKRWPVGLGGRHSLPQAGPRSGQTAAVAGPPPNSNAVVFEAARRKVSNGPRAAHPPARARTRPATRSPLTKPAHPSRRPGGPGCWRRLRSAPGSTRPRRGSSRR